MNILKMLQALGGLGAVVLYEIFTVLAFGKHFGWLSYMPVLLFPVILCVFVYARTPITSQHRTRKNKAQDQIAHFVSEAVTHYRLVCDFDQRTEFVDTFDESIHTFNKANRENNIVLLHNQYFVPWL